MTILGYCGLTRDDPTSNLLGPISYVEAFTVQNYARFCVATIACIWPSIGFSQGECVNNYETQFLSQLSVTKTFPSIVDNVTGGCLARPNDLERAAEISLRRNNLFFEGAPHPLVVNAFGTAASGRDFCVIEIEVSSYFWWEGFDIRGNKIPYPYLIWKDEVLIWGSKADVQRGAEDRVKDLVDSFFLAVDRAKDCVAPMLE